MAGKNLCRLMKVLKKWSSLPLCFFNKLMDFDHRTAVTRSESWGEGVLLEEKGGRIRLDVTLGPWLGPRALVGSAQEQHKHPTPNISYKNLAP